MASLTIKGITKRYGPVETLKGIDLDLADGEFLVLLGSSGCGKSTLLNIIAGLIEPSSGDVLIDGLSILRVHPKDRNIAMVFQSYALYPNMSVARNLGFGLEMRGIDKKVRQGAIEKVAALLQIDHLLDRKPAALSGGQRQMVAVGRALMTEPKLLLLDEPTAGLSPLVMEQIFERIVAVNRAGIGVLLVEQNARQALAIAHRGYVLATGRNRFSGTAQALLDNPEIGQTFLGG